MATGPNETENFKVSLTAPQTNTQRVYPEGSSEEQPVLCHTPQHIRPLNMVKTVQASDDGLGPRSEGGKAYKPESYQHIDQSVHSTMKL